MERDHDLEVRVVSRAWRPLEFAALAEVPVSTGVYALRDRAGGGVHLHVAGARSRFGLRGELTNARESSGDGGFDFTYVSTNNYFTLYREARDFPHRFDPLHPFVRVDGFTVAQRGPA